MAFVSKHKSRGESPNLLIKAGQGFHGGSSWLDLALLVFFDFALPLHKKIKK